MKRKLLNILKGIYSLKVNDPVRGCRLYRENGCSLVDTHLCDMKTCLTRKHYEQEKRERDICPTSCHIR